MSVGVLVASVGRPSLAVAMAAIEALPGHRAFVVLDPERRGANWARNAAFMAAFKAGCEYVRCADDDDVVLAPYPPHREDVLLGTQRRLGGRVSRAFPPAEQVSRGTYPALMSLRSDFAARHYQKRGWLFDPKVPCVQGSHALLSFWEAGASMAVYDAAPVYGYSDSHGVSDLRDKARRAAFRASWDAFQDRLRARGLRDA